MTKQVASHMLRAEQPNMFAIKTAKRVNSFSALARRVRQRLEQ